VTTEKIRRRTEEIRANALCRGIAHADEDALYLDVLTAIANGAENPAELALAALKTRDIDFARWCAA
jgi:hypothetical protein